MTIPALEEKRGLPDFLLSFAGLLGILGGIIIKKKNTEYAHIQVTS